VPQPDCVPECLETARSWLLKSALSPYAVGQNRLQRNARVSVFEIFPPEFVDELPLLEPETAFAMIVRRGFEHVARNMPGNRDDEDSWEAYRDAQHTAMNAIIASAKRLEIEPFASMEVPQRSDFDARNYINFKADLDHHITQTLIDSGIRQRRDSVAVPPKVKDRLKSHLHAMKTQIDQADMPEAKRAALHKKLKDFEVALERDKLPIFAVARIILEVLSLTANVLTLSDSPTFARLTSNIMQEVARAKADDDATRQLPPAEPPRIALPPRAAPKIEPKRSPMERRGSDLDDDIPF
jgi:hypothetical protein